LDQKEDGLLSCLADRVLELLGRIYRFPVGFENDISSGYSRIFRWAGRINTGYDDAPHSGLQTKLSCNFRR
jgi:hypothetical protein